MAALGWPPPNSSLDWNGTNSTNQPEENGSHVVDQVFDVVVLITMCFIILAMGAEATIPELKSHLRRPLGIAIGMVSQFIFLPLVSFATIKLLDLRGLYAASVLILSCSPGGGYSNLLTYLSEGDVTLSVTMTTVSNVLALGMTPLNIYLYSMLIEMEGIVTPYLHMTVSLLVLTVILVLGMAIRWKWPRVASVVTKVGIAASAIMAFACGAIAIIFRRGSAMAVPWHLYMAVLIVAPSGLAFAYLVALAFRLGAKLQRTIAIESAVQSIGTAMTIVIVSFPRESKKQASMYSILYACFTVVGLLCVIAVFRIYKRFCSQKNIEDHGMVLDKVDYKLTEE